MPRVPHKSGYDFPRARGERQAFDFTVGTGGKRLDVFLCERFEGYSRAFFQDMIREGRVLVNGERSKPSQTVPDGARIVIRLPEPRDRGEPVDLGFDVVHEDETLFVISKPAGVVVHPARGHLSGTIYHGLKWHFREALAVNPDFYIAMVHRLDADTSGLLVCAKSEAAHRELTRQLEHREVEKFYLAVVHGDPGFDEALLDGAIGVDPSDRHRMAIDGHAARASRTRVRVLARSTAGAAGGTFATVACELLTGRSHQIRVHLAGVGCPIAGDALYGGRSAAAGGSPLISRQALHAWRMGLTHPRSKDRLVLTAPIPSDIQNLLRYLRVTVNGSCTVTP